MSDLGEAGLTTTAVKDRLTQIRELVGEKNQKSMSLRLGLSPNAWRQMETVGGLPSADTLLRLAELGFSPTWVLTGQGAMRLSGPEGASEGAPVPASTLDDGLLTQVIELIEGWLEQQGRQLSPAAKARAISAAYDLCADRAAAGEQPAAFVRNTINKIMKIAG